MNLVADAGNSRIKWAFATEARDPVLETIHAGNAFYGKPDERTSSLTGVLESTWTGYPTPTRVVISNVGGDEVQESLSDWVKRHWRIAPEFVRSQASGWGVVNGYECPQALGVDRWVGLVAAYHAVKSSCCVVDGGTAVTIDAVDQQGHHIGGVIMPGLALMRGSLLEQTSRIRDTDGPGESGLGTDTGGAVASGTSFALIAGIERALAEVERVLGRKSATLVTGGDAVFISSAMSAEHKIEPNLVLKGLAIMTSNDQ